MEQKTEDKIFFSMWAIISIMGAYSGYQDGLIKGALLGLLVCGFFGPIVSVLVVPQSYIRFYLQRGNNRETIVFSPIGGGLCMTTLIGLGMHFGIFTTPAKWKMMVAIAGATVVIAILRKA